MSRLSDCSATIDALSVVTPAYKLNNCCFSSDLLTTSLLTTKTRIARNLHTLRQSNHKENDNGRKKTLAEYADQCARNGKFSISEFDESNRVEQR